MKTIVILHGWGSVIERWFPVKKLLEALGFKVFLPRLPFDVPRSTNDYSVWFKQAIQKIKPFILIGHSFGGQIAINFTAKYPEKVTKLVLINSAGIRNKLNLKRLFFLPLAKIVKSFIPNKFKGVFYRFILETDYFKASLVMKKTLKLVVREDQQTNLTKISQPTLIVWGKQDKLTPLVDGQLIHNLVKNSQLVVFPDARHSLPFTHSQALVSLINNFIDA